MDSKEISNNMKEKLKLINSNNKFRNIKSDYILQLFIDYTPKTTLKVIKYNKKMQKRMNINIKKYNAYSEIYSSIEIEILPKKKYMINL